MPRRAAVSVAPYGTQDILFRVSDPDLPIPATAKLGANGYTVYAAVAE